ncbi:DUF6624 domain-containing protein [Streptomyces bacillaris]|uniref:DUF6624 domain-containing protein n=1 Tax=Streptomyces bacillaris TaxID=68179 RepID=UPI0034605127
MNGPDRQEIVAGLQERAAKAREYRAKLIRSQLSDTEIDTGRHEEHANAEYLRRIASTYGWPGRSLVGEEAAEAALTIALYADDNVGLQRTLLRMIHEAAKRGEATITQWAHLYDRVLIRDQRPQVYGTQYRVTSEGIESAPIADPDNLDQRRASVGLPPYAEQAEALLRQYIHQPPHNPTEEST